MPKIKRGGYALKKAKNELRRIEIKIHKPNRDKNA